MPPRVGGRLVLALTLLVVSSVSGPANAGLYESGSSSVVDLHPTNFKRSVIESEDIWIVEFYAPWCGHCKALVPEYLKVADALKGIAKVGAVDADQHGSLGSEYGVQGFPTIKIFGLDKKKPEDYKGARKAKDLVNAALEALRSVAHGRLGIGGKPTGDGGKSKKGGDKKDVIELTDSNFEENVLESEDMWLVEFFAPWCGHCKNLEPHWASAATELRGKVKFGALDSTVHTVMASRYGVRGYPTIKHFPAGKKDKVAHEDYDGGRTSSDIIQWATEKLAANIPPPTVYQLTGDDVLKSACDDHQLCIVAVLPHILDCQSNCRNDYLDVLRKLGDKFKKHMWGWVWSEGGAQTQLEDSLGIGGFGYPAMAAMNARKMKYTLLRGSFSFDGINEFMKELAFGRASTLPVKGAKLPSIANIEPWDGKDGKLEIVEDVELDLGDEEDAPQKEEL